MRRSPFLLLACLLAVSAPGRASEKKLIYYGWGVRDTQYVRDHWQEMEKMPFDGMGIVVAVDREAWRQGKRDSNRLGGLVMGNRRFTFEEFAPAIADLQIAKWKRFTDNFLPVVLSSDPSAKDLGWFDDARWETVAANFGVVAQIAAASGMRGLILDPEHYGHSLFTWRKQPSARTRPFTQYSAVARWRGRQVMTAIADVLPKAVLLSLFAYTQPLSQVEKGAKVEDTDYGILPSFYDGILEAMPPAARLVDGYEFAYSFKEERQFQKARRRIREKALALTSSAALYREKVRVGFGLWLDYGARLEHFSPADFEAAVAQALRATDDYVWVYSQGPRFFPPSGEAGAYVEAIERARTAAGG